MEEAFAYARECDEPKRLVEGERGRLRVGHHPDAAHLVALEQREAQDMANQRSPKSKALGSPVDAESRQA